MVDYHVLPSLATLVAPIVGLGISTVFNGFSPEAQGTDSHLAALMDILTLKVERQLVTRLQDAVTKAGLPS